MQDNGQASMDNMLARMNYEYEWRGQHPNFPMVDNILKYASKGGQGKFGNPGYPDQIYINQDKRLLILVEYKPTVDRHTSGAYPEAFDEGEIDGIVNGIIKKRIDGKTNKLLKCLADIKLFKPDDYAVDGILWYLSFFKNKAVEKASSSNSFKNWKIIGIAVSGNVTKEELSQIDTFFIKDDKIVSLDVHELLSENGYIKEVNSKIKDSEIAEKIEKSAKKINQWLINLDSQNRPILLSALMICLFESKKIGNSFCNEFSGKTPKELKDAIIPRLRQVMDAENIMTDKKEVLLVRVESCLSDEAFLTKGYLNAILTELKNNVVPYFENPSNYDIIGKFYESFLTWAGVANKKKGIVLTPRHVTTLFTKLIEMKSTDIIMDPACGTGSFLIAGMNKLKELKINEENDVTQKIIESGYLENTKDFSWTRCVSWMENNVASETPVISRDDADEISCALGELQQKTEEECISQIKIIRERQVEEAIDKIKKHHLIGFENNATMYCLAISNMLFRGDGKSQIYYKDFFLDDAVYIPTVEEKKILEGSDPKRKKIIEKKISESSLGKLAENGIRPTIGFINPPYSGGYEDYSKLGSALEKAGNNENKKMWMKEICFLERMLDVCERYGIIIAPLSTYFSTNSIRNRILKKHTLKYVISMPEELFMPTASTETAIAVFECNKPHDYGNSVVFYKLSEDGFELDTNGIRCDPTGKWPVYEKKMLQEIFEKHETEMVNNHMVVRCLKKGNSKKCDEWIINPYLQTDYAGIPEIEFEKQLRKYAIYTYMKENNLLDLPNIGDKDLEDDTDWDEEAYE